ncbi:MAG: ATP-binding cassette domain-containing protein [Chthoniobacteraceae bacterium]
MLELQDLSLQVDGHTLLAEISARLPRRHLVAVLGPSGCGKSTLLKAIAGLREHTAGQVRWEGRDLSHEGDLDPHEIGYVPQFSIAYERLTVWENIEAASRLRVSGLTTDDRHAVLDGVLKDTGLTDIADRFVRLLSGGQRRRLALALELVSAPHLLLADEVTSGLDPNAEDEIVKLLRDLSRNSERLVIHVTHSLRHLAQHDSVLVLHEGHIVYHGSPKTLFHYFGVEGQEYLFARLGTRTAQEWHASWQKHREAYYRECGLATNSEVRRAAPTVIAPATPPLPSLIAQFAVLLARRWKLFMRDRGQLTLQLALLFGFPVLVAIFALNGLPQLPSPGGADSESFLKQVLLAAETREQFVRTGTLVSGLVMLQVVLLALIGSNNAAREIASERAIFEKEKFAGLRPLAYVGSKAVFLGVLIVAQSLWMALFVDWFVNFPGAFLLQAALLVLINAALTSVCLGLSSLLRSPEQASLVSIYLVGFQIPLSGAVLALPDWLAPIVRPFIASYWSWSGFIDTLRAERYFDAVRLVTETKFEPFTQCAWFLVCHVTLGLVLAIVGCKSSRWE